MPPKKAKVVRRKRVGRPAARVESQAASSANVHGNTAEHEPVGVNPAGAAQGVDQTAAYAAMMEELQRYRDRYGDQMRNDPVVGNVHQQAAPLNDQNHGVQPPPPPPPPPPVVHVQAQGPSYWELMGHMRNMQMDYFDGKSSAVVADNWRKKLEKNLDAIRCPQEYRLDLAVHYLKDDAMFWWDGVVEAARGRYELTWADFREEFTREYFPPEAMDKMENAFEDLRQGNRTVREYKEEFNRLRRFSTKHLSEADQIRKFMKGLRLDLKNRCSIRKYDSLLDLVETAAVQEQGFQEELKLSKGFQAKTGKGDSHKRSWDTANSAPAAREYAKDLICYNCKQRGHLRRDCPVGNVPRMAQPRAVQPERSRCFRCGQNGHFARDCMVLLQGQQPRGPNREQLPLPPPPAGQGVRPRVNVVGEHGGVEPIAGMLFPLDFCVVY